MDDEPHDTGDVVTFGPARQRFRRLPRPVGTPAAGTRRSGTGHLTPNRVLAVAVAIIVALTITVIAQAVQLPGHPTRARPAAVQVAVGAFAEFPLKGASGAVLQTQYLQAGHGRSYIWLTLAAAGLPGGYDYTALVGDCVRGRPRTLTGLSEIPDYQTGIWLESFKMPGTPGTIHWVTVTRAGESEPRGGIRGSFVYAGRLVAIPPGHLACP